MTALTRLTEAEYDTLKNQIDGENGAGFALYVAFSRQSNAMGVATPLTQTFADNLLASYNNRLPFDRTLPSYITYSAVFDEYEAALPPVPTPAPATPPARTPRVRRPAATPPAPAGGGSADPLGEDELDDFGDDSDDAPIAPVTSRPVHRPAARFTPPAPPAGEPTIADVFTFFGGLVPTVENHADMLDEHEAELFNPDGTSRLDQLEDAVFGGANPARPWTRRTSSAHVSDEASWGKIVGVAIVTFLGAFLVLLAVVGIVGAAVNYGPIAAIATWLWPITLLAIMAAIVASLVTYRSTTASAVTREERI